MFLYSANSKIWEVWLGHGISKKLYLFIECLCFFAKQVIIYYFVMSTGFLLHDIRCH